MIRKLDYEIYLLFFICSDCFFPVTLWDLRIEILTKDMLFTNWVLLQHWNENLQTLVIHSNVYFCKKKSLNPYNYFRVEKKVHTLVLFVIFEDSIILINHHGLKLAEFQVRTGSPKLIYMCAPEWWWQIGWYRVSWYTQRTAGTGRPDILTERLVLGVLIYSQKDWCRVYWYTHRKVGAGCPDYSQNGWYCVSWYTLRMVGTGCPDKFTEQLVLGVLIYSKNGWYWVS